MNKVSEYVVLMARSGEELDSFVAARLANGWQPQGGLAVMVNRDNNNKFCQALVRYAQPATITNSRPEE